MRKPVLLLVEDEEDDAFFFRRTFAECKMEFTVRHVSTGRAAMDFLHQAVQSNALPGIIFLDLKMPIVSGFDLLEWLQQDPACAKIPAVVLSGSDVDADMKKAQRLGALDYVVKPLTAEVLRKVMLKAFPAAVRASDEIGARA